MMAEVRVCLLSVIVFLVRSDFLPTFFSPWCLSRGLFLCVYVQMCAFVSLDVPHCRFRVVCVLSACGLRMYTS